MMIQTPQPWYFLGEKIDVRVMALGLWKLGSAQNGRSGEGANNKGEAIFFVTFGIGEK